MLGGVPTAFRPLRHRDFRLLWTGLAISLVGSGLWLVALAWQVIELGGGPTELSLVTALFSVGLLAFVLIGGVAADRLSQRLVMLAADLIRAAVLLVLGLLSLSGDLRIWHLAAGGLLIGAGEAFFIPSYTALLPHLLPEDELLAANGLEGTLRPLAQQAAGPALGGIAVAALSPGVAILTGGLAYLVSAGCLLVMKVRPRKVPAAHGAPGVAVGLLRFARRLPLRAKDELAVGDALVRAGSRPVHYRAPGGAAAFRHPRQPRGWGRGLRSGPGRLRGRRGRRGARDLLGTAAAPLSHGHDPHVGPRLPAVRRYRGGGALWVMCAALFVVGATYSAAMVIWGTLLQRRVPEGLRGRVSSLDFFVSLALMPVSMAIAGPAGAAFGITAVFIVAGIVPVFLAVAAIVIPRLDRDELAHPLDHPEPARSKNVSGSTQNEPKGSERL